MEGLVLLFGAIAPTVFVIVSPTAGGFNARIERQS
jgi:hypothetical protein